MDYNYSVHYSFERTVLDDDKWFNRSEGGSFTSRTASIAPKVTVDGTDNMDLWTPPPDDIPSFTEKFNLFLDEEIIDVETPPEISDEGQEEFAEIEAMQELECMDELEAFDDFESMSELEVIDEFPENDKFYEDEDVPELEEFEDDEFEDPEYEEAPKLVKQKKSKHEKERKHKIPKEEVIPKILETDPSYGTDGHVYPALKKRVIYYHKKRASYLNREIHVAIQRDVREKKEKCNFIVPKSRKYVGCVRAEYRKKREERAKEKEARRSQSSQVQLAIEYNPKKEKRDRKRKTKEVEHQHEQLEVPSKKRKLSSAITKKSNVSKLFDPEVMAHYFEEKFEGEMAFDPQLSEAARRIVEQLTDFKVKEEAMELITGVAETVLKVMVRDSCIEAAKRNTGEIHYDDVAEVMNSLTHLEPLAKTVPKRISLAQVRKMRLSAYKQRWKYDYHYAKALKDGDITGLNVVEEEEVVEDEVKEESSSQKSRKRPPSPLKTGSVSPKKLAIKNSPTASPDVSHASLVAIPKNETIKSSPTNSLELSQTSSVASPKKLTIKYSPKKLQASPTAIKASPIDSQMELFVKPSSSKLASPTKSATPQSSPTKLSQSSPAAIKFSPTSQ